MSVMLFHSSFISSTTPFSALMAQFTGTALWEALLWLGMCVCARARVRSVTHCHIFLSSAFKLCQRLDKKYSVELLQARWAEQNSFRILALDPHLTLQPNITVLFFRQ